MTTVQCPICDYEVDLAQAPSGIVPGLAESLGLTGLSTAQVDYIEKDLGEHLLSHSVTDWVTAMRMADAYIERLEESVTGSARVIDELGAKVRALSERQAMAPPPSIGPPPQVRPGLGAPPPPPGVAGLDPWAFDSPRERQEAARARRKAGLSYVPTETLIPHIPSGKRPEGVVGRKL